MLSRFFARLALSLAVLLIVLVAAVTAFGYFAYALYLVFLSVVVPPAAAVLTGVIVLLAAILLVVATRAGSRARRRRTRDIAPSVDVWENAAELGSELGRKVRGLSESHASGGLMAALVAGFAVGVSPKLRAFLQSILKP